MKSSTRAIVFRNINEVDIQTFPVPELEAGHLLCRVSHSLVSTGTELRVLRGAQKGTSFPLIPGYSWIGEVVAVAPDVTGISKGEWVSGRESLPLTGVGCCWGGHVGVHVTPAHSCVKLPANASPLDYVLTEVAAISHRGVSITCPCYEETALVCGQGLIGALATFWLLHAGVRVIAVDMVESRLKRAEKLGAWAINGNAPDVKERILRLVDGGVDIAVEASASMAGARLCGAVLRETAATTAFLGFRPDEGPANTRYWPRFCVLATHTQPLELPPTGLVNSEGALVLHPKDRRTQDRMAVIERIRAGDLKTADFIPLPVDVNQAPDVYRMLREDPESGLSAVFDWAQQPG